MRTANTLRELLQIRRKHAAKLRKVTGYLGSAVGFKWKEDEGRFDEDANGARIPAVLVFVVEKKNPKDIPPGEMIDALLTTADGLSCATDVIRGRLPEAAPSAPALSPENKTLLKALRDGSSGVIGGMTLRVDGLVGTAACVVRDKKSGQLGLLTNQHVAEKPGTTIEGNVSGLVRLGLTKRSLLTAPKTPQDLDDLETFVTVKQRLDCAHIELDQAAAKLARPGVHGVGPLGPTYQLNLDSLEVLGQKVLGVGQTRGLEHGTIIAYGYEWADDDNASGQFATNYLIIGDAKQPFAGPGDSGKLVITDDAQRRPIALLWGGERQKFWSNGQAQDSWAYASDLAQALQHLEVELHQ
jgi:hypothetical protein